jgi:hypothetical protein
MSGKAAGHYKLNGRALSADPQQRSVMHDGKNGIELPAGAYVFEVTLDPAQ